VSVERCESGCTRAYPLVDCESVVELRLLSEDLISQREIMTLSRSKNSDELEDVDVITTVCGPSERADHWYYVVRAKVSTCKQRINVGE
jgi:hypothetical protein